MTGERPAGPGTNVTPSAVAVGTFDGVHRGHRFVIDRMVSAAAAAARRAVLVSFAQHPLRVIRPDAAPLSLTTPDEKLEALAAAGLDRLVVLPFTAELANLSAEEFVQQVLIDRYGMRDLFVGHDHGFGRGRSGDVPTLRRLGDSLGFVVHVVPPVEGSDGRPVSSSAIRRAVQSGDLSRAADGLGRPYAISGIVQPGDGRGASLGFRTLNLGTPPAPKLLPPDGVYAVRVAGARGVFAGMANLGPRPTFGDPQRTLEAHLFDAAGDWYGQRARVDFIGRIRDVRSFTAPAGLVRQLRADEEIARVLVARAAAGLRIAQPIGRQEDRLTPASTAS